MSKNIGVFLDTNQVGSDAKPQQHHTRFNIDTSSLSTTNRSITASHNLSMIHAMETRARKFAMRPLHVLPQCKPFLPLEDLARCIIEEVVELAEENANNILDQIEDEMYWDIYRPPSRKSSDLSDTSAKVGQTKGAEHSFDNLSSSPSSMFSLISSSESSSFSTDSSMKWPTIGEFNIYGAMEKIEEYLLFSCPLEENWHFVVNFLGKSTDDYSHHYHYEAVFTLPTTFYPVAQVVARIFFTVDVSKMGPKECDVEVYYWFEGNRLMHKIGRYEIQDRWLTDILEMKLQFYKSIEF